MKVEYDKVQKELSKSFNNIKKLKGKQIKLKSDESLTLETPDNGVITIKINEKEKTYEFYRTEESSKVVKDKEFFHMNISDDPGIVFDLNVSHANAIYQSIEILKKYNKNLLSSKKML